MGSKDYKIKLLENFWKKPLATKIQTMHSTLSTQFLTTQLSLLFSKQFRPLSKQCIY